MVLWIDETETRVQGIEVARICRAEEWRGGVFVEKAPQNLHSIHSIVEYMKHLMYLTTDARRVIFHSRTKLPLKKSYSSPTLKNKPLKVHPGLLMACQTGVQSSLKDYSKIQYSKANLHCAAFNQKWIEMQRCRKILPVNQKKNKSMEMYWEMTEMMELVFKNTKIILANVLIMFKWFRGKHEHKEEVNSKSPKWIPRNEKYLKWKFHWIEWTII